MSVDITILDERDGWLYVSYVTTDWNKPKQITHLWPIGVRFADFARRFSCEEEARKRIGNSMRDMGNGYFSDEHGLTYRLMNGGSTQPACTEITDVPEPKQRGKKLPVAWRE